MEGVEAMNVARAYSIFCCSLLMASVPACPAQLIHSPQIQIEHKPAKEDLSWLWQYTRPAPDGREVALTHDPHFVTFLEEHFMAPQSFWNNGNTPLADTAVEFLATHGTVVAYDNRYITVTGCVPELCPSRGMLFVDTGGSRPLAVFAAIDWSREGHTTAEDDAEYTLWIFPDRALNSEPPALSSPKGHLPEALQRSVRRFSAALNGGRVPPLVTRAFVIEPDGVPHELPASATGATRFHDLPPLTAGVSHSANNKQQDTTR
jgi:hypothetical protein